MTVPMMVWDETQEAWVAITLPVHEFHQDPNYAGLRQWCETCAHLYDEKWGPGMAIHQVPR